MTSWSALVLAVLTATNATGLAAIRYNAPPPNFTIPATGGARDLYALHGRVVVINFWATWCGVCISEMPTLARVQQTFGDRVSVVTVSPESKAVAATYFHFANIALPIVEDGNGAISRAYSISKIPVTLVLDPQGAVSYVSVGALSWDELRAAVERAALPGSSPGASTHSPRVLQ